MGTSAIGWEWGAPGAFPSRVFFDKRRLFSYCLVRPIPRFPSSFLDDLFLRSPAHQATLSRTCAAEQLSFWRPHHLSDLRPPRGPCTVPCSLQRPRRGCPLCARAQDSLSPHPPGQSTAARCHLISPGALDPGEQRGWAESSSPGHRAPCGTCFLADTQASRVVTLMSPQVIPGSLWPSVSCWWKLLSSSLLPKTGRRWNWRRLLGYDNKS